MHDDKMYTFFNTIKKKSTDFDESRYFFPENGDNDNHLTHLTNHDEAILTIHGKILTNLTLMVAGNDRLTTDGKGILPSYLPFIITDFVVWDLLTVKGRVVTFSC